MSHYIDIHSHNPLKLKLGVQNFRLGMEEKPASGHFSAGIHPWDAERLLPHSAELLSVLEELDCIAIGEVGLDKACDTPFDTQKKIFEAQVKVAERRNLPLIIHCVKAQVEVVEILRQYTIKSVIFHGFIGTPQQLQELISKGYYISFGFNALKSPKTIKAIESCPIEKMFLESDVATENIANIYDSIAAIKSLKKEELTGQITNNYKQLFQ